MTVSFPRSVSNGLKFLLLIILPIALTSCTEVWWENPLSSVEEMVSDVRLPGAWGLNDPKTGSPAVMLFIGKSVDGWMSFCFWLYEEGKINKSFGKMFVSKIDRRTFLNVRLDWGDGNLTDFYHIVEYKLHEKKLWLYYPEGDFVKTALEGKEISGEMKEKGFLIHSSSEEIRDFIRRSSREKLFYSLLDQPLERN